MQSEAQRKATEKYNKKKYDFISFRAEKGKKEIIDLYANKNNISISGYINLAIDNQLKKDGFEPSESESEPEKE